MYLTCPTTEEIYDGFGALEFGNLTKAETHFKNVLESQGGSTCLDMLDLIEAHNGMGAVSLAHRDLMDAKRWYHEGKFLLEKMYEHGWPKKLSWANAADRPAIRNLFGHANVHYASGETAKAKQYYEQLLHADYRDELGIKKYLAAITAGKHYDDVR